MLGAGTVITYEDFSLKIEPKRGDHYPVIVLRSPAGEGRSSFHLPFDPYEIGDILFDLGQTVRGTGPAPLRDVSPGATRTRPQQIGDQLFNALFSGPIRSLLDRSLGMIHGHQRGLRIKLHIDPEDPDLAQLASLPWEFMYRKETRDFLNLSRFTPILRYLDVQRPYTPLPLELPLRILVVISDPFEYAKLDLDRERALIEASWARQEGVQVEFMERATILALQDRLADQAYHVLHYMGHGDFDERAGRGVLVMEDEVGQGAMVDGSTLGVLLRDLPTMRLVFLNACETARVTKETGLDPFAGVAAAMVMAGIPAVVAMQFPISDRAAITFSQRFYPLLARGDPVDAAVAEGRRAIRLAEARTMEWGTPVLFMRAPQGVIFRVSEAQREKVPLSQIPELPEEVDEALEQRLEALYTRGLSAFWLEEWEKAAQSFQAIVQVRPDYEDAADKLAASQRQARLQALYRQALAAREAEDWATARATLGELVTDVPDYKDAAALLEWVTRQGKLADLYAEAQRLRQAEQWQAVINVFGQIQAAEPDYADPDELLSIAEQAVAVQKRQAELNDLYGRAVRALDAGHWLEAYRLLAQMQEMEPGYRETERLLARVEGEIEHEKAQRQRQEQIATLYEQAVGLAGARQWRQVQVKMEEIETLDPEFADPEGIAARAQEEVAQEEEEARRQNELAALYADAERLLNAGQYQEALETWDELRARDPQYPDRQKVQAKARKKLKALARGTQGRRGLPRWPLAVLGGLALVVVVGGALLLSGGFGWGRSEVGPTAAPVGVAATATLELTDTPRPATPTPTNTPRPGTPTPTLELPPPVSGVLSDVKVLYHDDFDELSSAEWEYESEYVRASQGIVEFTGAPGCPRLQQRRSLNEGEGVLVLFEYGTDAAFAVNLGSGEWGTPDWREWDLSGNSPEVWFTQGTASDVPDRLFQDLKSHPHAWYYLLVAVGEEGEIVARVWERDNLSQIAEYHRVFGEDWAGRDWHFWIDGWRDKVYFDSFTVLSFSGIRGKDAALPSPVSDVLPEAKVLYHDDFDQWPLSTWEYESGKASDGVVQITGTADWSSYLERDRIFHAGDAVLALFKYDADADYRMYICSGEWEKPAYRRWGIFTLNDSSRFTTDRFQGFSFIGGDPLAGNLTSRPDTWYYVLLAVGDEGEFLAQVWERDDPARKAEDRRRLGDDWAGLPWHFILQANKGPVYVDTFTEISFSEIK
jgi:tetratricopeptide (TPR) repeat protein